MQIEDLKSNVWNDDEIFVIRLNTALKKRGIPRSCLAKSGVVGHGTINSYGGCKGNHTPTGFVLQRICTAINCSADYLLGLKDEDV